MAKDLSLPTELPPAIKNAGQNGELVLFVGAGVSSLVGFPSWETFAKKTLDDLRQKEYLNYSEIDQLKRLSPKIQLSIAANIAQQKEYKLNQKKYFTCENKNSNIYDTINKIGAFCVTTNYDEQLEPRFNPTDDGSTTEVSVTRISDKREFHANKINNPGTVIHLHGSISQPETMVITTAQYLEHYQDDTVKNFLTKLFRTSTVLFIGYGLEEVEILEHILRSGIRTENKETSEEIKLFALQGFFKSEQPLYDSLHKYYEESFRLHLIGFVRDEENYQQLEKIMGRWQPDIEIQKPFLKADLNLMNKVFGENGSLVDKKDLEDLFDTKQEIHPLFFQKVKGLQWFDFLHDRNYFNPKPEPTRGGDVIPFSSILNYLIKTAPELANQANEEYAKKFINIIIDTTKYAKDNNSNYYTWLLFAEILSKIPYHLIPLNIVDSINYWLDDKFNADMVANEIGEKWLPQLLETNDPHALRLAAKILIILYKINFDNDKLIRGRKYSFRYDSHSCLKITNKIAKLSGEKLQKRAIKIFGGLLNSILKTHQYDELSHYYRRAIENHSQNIISETTTDILINAYRDALLAYTGSLNSSQYDEILEYIIKMLSSDYKIIHRLAIHIITENFHIFLTAKIIDNLLVEKYLENDYRHEMWHFLNKNYKDFSGEQKNKIRQLISNINININNSERATAYAKSSWLSAIKDYGNKEKDLYKKQIEILQTEPEHPDFVSYVSLRPSVIGNESPITFEEMRALPRDALQDKLKNYASPEESSQIDMYGLLRTFKQFIKTEAHSFYLNITEYKNFNSIYIHEIIGAYTELWNDKAQLAWDEIWKILLDFCHEIINQELFWSDKNEEQSKSNANNRLIISIAQLIEAGVKSDDHAFSEKYLEQAEDILAHLLNKEEGEGHDAKNNFDSLTLAINSPRGACLAALINLTLRQCRITDKSHNKDHTSAWKHFQHYYDDGLNRTDENISGLEFFVLISAFLPNFLYMSKEWTVDNLNIIFDKKCEIRWRYAMDGYAYSYTIDKDVYLYLKENGDLLKILQMENIGGQIKERIIQLIVIAYIDGWESINEENSLINRLISLNNIEEIDYLIDFMWRNKRIEDIGSKVSELWVHMQFPIDSSDENHQKIPRNISKWIELVDWTYPEIKKIILKIARWVGDDNLQSYGWFKSISNISEEHPKISYQIAMAILKNSKYCYTGKELGIKLLSNLHKSGAEGQRQARKIVDEYIKKGDAAPSEWLDEIKRGDKN